MKKLCLICIISFFIFLSCYSHKEVKEEIALLDVPPKNEVEKPVAKQAIVLPEKPLEEVKEEEVIPPEKEIGKPAAKQVIVLPGKLLEQVKEEEIILPEKEIRKFIEKPAIVLKKAAVEEKIEVVPPWKKIKEPIKKPPTVIFGKPFKKKIVLFPFENLTNNSNALKHAMSTLISQLERKGYKVVAEDSLYDFLCKKRIRFSGYISNELALEIKEEFSAKFILTGAIVLFSSGENPQIGLLARLIDSSDGTILWANYASITGNDFTGILELGRINTISKLIPKAMGRLLASFSTAPLQEEEESTYRIAVLPFLNKSEFKNAGMIATYLFLVDLLNNKKFIPVEYGNVRKLIVDLRIRSKGDLEFGNIEALSKELDVKGILVGTVERYSVSNPPTVAITTRLLDARKNRILWYNTHQLTGEEDIIAFDWGRIRTVDKVAYKVVSELVEKMETEKWR